VNDIGPNGEELFYIDESSIADLMVSSEFREMFEKFREAHAK
jgi:hypothetical protein